MEWIKRIGVGEEPNPKLEKILVWGKCGCPHVAFYDYGGWHHTECCFKDGEHFMGDEIDFDFWMPIPKQPERLNPEGAITGASNSLNSDNI